MLNFDLGNMAKWYNENSGGCPSWLTCISDASIQSLSSINIAHIELYFAGRTLTVPIPENVNGQMVLRDKTFQPGFSFTANATFWQIGIQLSLGMVWSDTFPSFSFSFSLKNLDIPKMLRQAMDRLTEMFGGSGVDNMPEDTVFQRTTKSMLQELLDAIEFIVPRIDNLEILNFNSATLLGGGKGPTFRFQGKWLGVDYDINFETELAGFQDGLLSTIIDYFKDLLPACFINLQCSGETPWCSHNSVSAGNPQGWQCVAQCNTATEIDLGWGLGCWPKYGSGSACLWDNQCFSGDCSGLRCTTDCDCSSAAVPKGPCNAAGTDCLACADPASNQFLIEGKCHECVPSDAVNGHALCESQGSGGKYCHDGTTDTCEDCHSTCKTCGGGGSSECTSCDTSGDYRYSSGGVTGNYCVRCTTNDHCRESEYCDEDSANPVNTQCKSCPTALNCRSCKETTTGGVTCETCPDGRYVNSITGACDPCMANEAQCGEYYCDTGACCSGNTYNKEGGMYQNFCGPTCENNHYLNGNTAECEECIDDDEWCGNAWCYRGACCSGPTTICTQTDTSGACYRWDAWNGNGLLYCGTARRRRL